MSKKDKDLKEKEETAKYWMGIMRNVSMIISLFKKLSLEYQATKISPFIEPKLDKITPKHIKTN